ncbi:MAG: hypothetical protein QXM89_05040, partial [Candidatus Bathyarchaeia archaeon]
NVYTVYWWWYNHPSTPQSHATVHVVLFNIGGLGYKRKLNAVDFYSCLLKMLGGTWDPQGT